MDWYRHLHLRWKLITGFGVLLALLVAVAGFGLYNMADLEDTVGEMHEEHLLGLGYIMQAKLDLIASDRAEKDAILAEDHGEAETHATAARKHLTLMLEQLDTFEKAVVLDETRRLLQEVRRDLREVQASRESILTLALAGKDADARAEAARVRLVVDRVGEALDKLQKGQERLGQEVSEQATAGYERARAVMLGLVIAAFALGLTIALFIARGVVHAVRPVMATMTSLTENCATGLAAGLGALAGGDLTMRLQAVTPPIERYGTDELGQLAATANVLRDRLVACIGAYEQSRADLLAIIGQVRDVAVGVADASQQLGSATNRSRSVVQQVTQAIQHLAEGAQETSRSAQSSSEAVDQLAQAIDSIARGAQDQAQQVQVAASTTTQMAASIEQVAGNAQTVAAASQQTRASAEHGARAVRETVAGMQEIKDVVREAAGKVEELGKLGEKIGAVVETIDDIAEQTNLLALNAAIEAARAGEHGRGFAVVADEVRKLAERSQRETKAISELIHQVQAGTKDAVRAMEVGSAKVEQGTLMADQAGASLSEILTAVEATVGQVGGIAAAAQEVAAGARSVVDTMSSISAVVEESSAATEQMAAQASQMTSAIQSIADVSEENSAATEQVSASAGEMSAQVEEMSAQAQDLANTAIQLTAFVARFRLESAGEGSRLSVEAMRQITDAIAAHGKWRTRLTEAIRSGYSDIEVATASQDNQCAFGRWLYESASVELKASSFYKRVRALHAHFHTEAGKVLDLAVNGQAAAARQAMAPDSAFNEVSQTLVQALLAWQKGQEEDVGATEADVLVARRRAKDRNMSRATTGALRAV